jgi:TonB-dependent starch-binding outer membrane protein SusC
MRQYYSSVLCQAVVYLGSVFPLFSQSPTPKDSIRVKSFHQNSTVAIQTIDATRLPTVPTFSLDQALVGNVAGGLLSSVSGKLGSQANIQLRGFNTISTITMPLVLVDGVQLGGTQLNALDPNMVQRVEIIPGAAAGAIYGYQGANGVISIFTKQGQSGKLQLDFSTSVAQNEFLNNGNLQKAKLHSYQTNSTGELTDANGIPISLNPNNLNYSGNIVYAALDPNGTFNKTYKGKNEYHDHFNQFLKPTFSTTNWLSVSGGGNVVTARFTASNNSLENNFSNDGHHHRTNLGLNLGINISKRLQVRSITQLSLTENTINHFSELAFQGMLKTRPFVDYAAKDTDGNYGLYYGDVAGQNGSNPNYYFQYSKRVSNLTDLIQSFHASYQLTKNISLQGRYGINSHQQDETTLIKDQSTNKNSVFNSYYLFINNQANATGEKQFYKTNDLTENAILNATVEIDFQKDLNLSVPIISTTSVNSEWRSVNNRVSKTATFNGSTFPLSNTSEIFKTNSTWIHQSIEYNRWLKLSGSYRRDFSDVNPNSELNPFLHGGLSVSFSDLKFWNQSEILSKATEFRLRAAIGKAGIPVMPASALNAGIYFEPWESSIERETGFDLSVTRPEKKWFKKTDFSFTYWARSNPQSPFLYKPASTSGVSPFVVNMSLYASGTQFSLGSSIYSGKKVEWNFQAYFNQQESRIENLSQGFMGITFSSSSGPTTYLFQLGNGIGQIYGTRLLTSVDQKDENGNFYIPQAQQSAYSVASNGYVVNSSTKRPIATANSYALGNSQPKFNASFINEVKFKGVISLSFQIDWFYKSHLYNQIKEWMYRDGIHGDYDKPITINNTTGAWTAFYRGAYQVSGSNATTTYFYEEASFVRLRNVSLKLDLLELTRISKIRKLRLEISGRNLWTLTNYSGMDPEVNSGGLQSSWDNGVDNGTFPNFKSYQVGLNFGI